MLCKKKKKKKKTEKGRCYGAQCIMGRTIKIAVVFTQHGVGLVRSASGGLTDLTKQPMYLQANPHLSNPSSSSSSISFIAAKPLPITEVICCYKRDVFGTAFNYFCFS